MAGGSALPKKRPLVLVALAVVVALAIATTLAVTKPWASTKTRDDVAPPAGGDRLLQSVDVTMQGDGALTRVGDTVVIARAAGGSSDTYTTTYDPTKVVDQLPVRVLTSYATDKGSGTDLDDLEGYTGRVTINLSVQNLTVRPQQITYDSAGRSQTTSAVVGAPLTVVASAALPGVDPAAVVTAAPDGASGASGDTGSTNGVLSRGQDDSTQVQWASILAPPQLDATATFRVVLDAKDLQLPTIDLSVQPGLVTDPSVGALIDAAFNPKNSSELALETRTIKVIGDVNDVLDRASGTISGVRKTLDASSKTLGTKTVQSLTEDTKTISTSLKSSSDNIDALGDDLKGSLESTQSATLERMSETVSGLQDLIGDTSAPEPSVSTTGEGCATQVKASGGGSGVYGALLKVTAQLSSYQLATDACKQVIQAEIAANIGSVDGDGNPVCTADDPVTDVDEGASVVCSLQDVQKQLDDIFAGVTTSVAEGQAAAGSVYAAVQSARTDLGTQLAALAALTAAPDEKAKGTGTAGDRRLADRLRKAAAAAAALDDGLGNLTTALQGVRGDAAENQKKVVSIGRQSDDLAAALCAVQGNGTQPGRLSRTQVERLRSYLVGTSCDGKDRLRPPGGWSVPVVDRLDTQRRAWERVQADLSTSGDDGVADALGELRAQIKELTDALAGDRATLAKIRAQVLTSQRTLATLGDEVDDSQTAYGKAKGQLDVALEQAAAQATTAQATRLEPTIKQVAAEAEESSQQLGTAFDESAKGLGSAADALRDGTVKTLKQQQRDLEASEKESEAELSSKTKAGLSTISGSIGSATRDIDTTRTTLTKDLDNVLLDLGNPEQPGKGLLGTLGKSARAADSADFQLGLASDTVSSYASVRSQEVDGLLLRQAQAEAALQRQAELPAFATDLPSNVQHRTVYLFHLGGNR